MIDFNSKEPFNKDLILTRYQIRQLEQVGIIDYKKAFFIFNERLEKSGNYWGGYLIFPSNNLKNYVFGTLRNQKRSVSILTSQSFYKTFLSVTEGKEINLSVTINKQNDIFSEGNNKLKPTEYKRFTRGNKKKGE